MKSKLKAIVLSSLFAVSTLCASVGMAIAIPAQARGGGDSAQSQAYFVRSERDMMGAWYAGDKDGDGQNVENRYRGKEGAILMYQYSMPDGHTYSTAEELNNFNDNSEWTKDGGAVNPDGSKIHYVELPDWVNNVEGNIADLDTSTFQGGSHWYWNRSQMTYEKWQARGAANANYKKGLPKAVMPVDIERSVEEAKKYPSRISDPNSIYLFVSQEGTAPFLYDVDVTDDDWHLVTIYVGTNRYDQYDGYEQYEGYVCIKDPEGNVLAEHVVKDIYKTQNVTFAVKGDFTIHASRTDSAMSTMELFAIYFDAMPTFDTEVSVTNFTAKRVNDPKYITLSWKNTTENQITSVYRREKGQSDAEWVYLTETDAGATSYVDVTTSVSKTYEYMLSSGLKRTAPSNKYFVEPNLVDYNLPDTASIQEISTAPYKRTKIVLDKVLYDVAAKETLKIKATLYKIDENGEYVPYEGQKIQFTLNGEKTHITGTDIATMQTDLGCATTSKSGTARFSYEQPYAGVYTITASITAVPDEYDPEQGYDACSTTASFVMRGEEYYKAPVLSTISEAIKPGETVTITGYNLAVDSLFQIVYAPNAGKTPEAFDDDAPSKDYKYMSATDLLTYDSEGENGLMFILPETENAGTYDFWVRTQYGWSNGITLNATRAIYLSQEASYEGLPIEIVGRNFFQSEYGIGTDASSMDSLRVKLVNKENPSIFYIVPVEKGIRYTAKQSATGKEVYDSNPYKITFITPNVSVYGRYDVFVAADGVDFRELEEPQVFEIVKKKAQSWDTTVFGADYSSHIGNDPLDLQVYWAQDLNYIDNVHTMKSNATEALKQMNALIAQKLEKYKDATTPQETVLLGSVDAIKTYTENLKALIRKLGQGAGGIIYFPAGDYYISGMNVGDNVNNVLFIGDKDGGTNIHFVNSRAQTEYFFQMGSQVTADGKPTGSCNVGWARLNFDRYTIEQPAPNKFKVFMEDPDMVIYAGSGSTTQNIATYVSYNKFVSQCNLNFNYQTNYRATMVIAGEKNILMQHINHVGGASLQWGRSYKYQTIRNCIIDGSGVSSCTVFGLAKYTIMENIWGSNNYAGHGLKIGAYGYIGNCYVSKTGERGADAKNNGEAILIEPPTNYFSVGSVLSATARSFTYAQYSGTIVTEATRCDAGDISVYITDGKGVGQVRRLKYVGQGEYGNYYEFLDGEKDWDVIPDETSLATIVAPSICNTIYATTVEDTLKPILLYGNNFDTIVANCTTIDSEGIALCSITVGSVGRFTANIGIRVENNTIIGTSPVTGYGGIYTQVSRDGGSYCGHEVLNITIKNNVLKDIYPDTTLGWEFKPGVSEVMDASGIIVSGAGSVVDIVGSRFITVENNTVDGCDGYGIYCSSGVDCLVVRNNKINNVGTKEEVTLGSPTNTAIMGHHTLYVNGEVSSLSGEYKMGVLLPETEDYDGMSFLGWTTSSNFQDGDDIVTLARATDTTLYAVYGYKVQLMLNYEKNGVNAGVGAEYVVQKNAVVQAQVKAFGEPFRVGYTFGGWYIDAACTQQADLTTPITQNTKLYAKWTSDETSMPNNPDDSTKSKSGCSRRGIIGTSATIICLIIAVAAHVVIKKRKNDAQ